MVKNSNYLYKYVEGYISTITDNQSDTQTNLALLLFRQWYPKGTGDYAGGRYRFENYKKIYNLSLNYFTQADVIKESDWLNLLPYKIERVSGALDELKQIQIHIKNGEWEEVREFHNRNFYYHFNDARTDGQIHKDEFFVWLVWELIEMTEDYLNRMDPTGKEQLNDTDRF
ncbi:hypothetical protein [uncultured Vagococcus sp.]|uniref:hypothetical protein n=1 Tax=uncultured Vagococcus sp. TaxID=189676 RepID=UPI0028D7A277|nr:hypothetical protein [uncultured Vagococcus sp.]